MEAKRMDADKFGSFIARRRKQLNMTQAELASKIHVTDKAVSRWERGLGFPDINTIEPLADALELSIVEIMKSEEIGRQDVSVAEASTIISDSLKTIANNQKKKRKSICGMISICAFILSASLLIRNVIFDYSSSAIFWFDAWLISTIIFACSSIFYGMRMIFKHISPYAAFAAADITVGIAATIFSVYDIKTDDGFLAGILGKVVLSIAIPTVVLLLLTDIIIWLIKRSTGNSIEKRHRGA